MVIKEKTKLLEQLPTVEQTVRDHDTLHPEKPLEKKKENGKNKQK